MDLAHLLVANASDRCGSSEDCTPCLKTLALTAQRQEHDQDEGNHNSSKNDGYHRDRETRLVEGQRSCPNLDTLIPKHGIGLGVVD